MILKVSVGRGDIRQQVNASSKTALKLKCIATEQSFFH